MSKAETVFLSLFVAYIACAILGNVALYFWFKRRETPESFATIVGVYKDIYITSVMKSLTNKWLVFTTVASFAFFYAIGWHTTVMLISATNTLMIAGMLYFHIKKSSKVVA